MIKTLKLILLTITLSYSQHTLTLGPNLLVNHDFSSPSIYQSGVSWIYLTEVPGWSCSNICEYNGCQATNKELNLYRYPGTHGFMGDCKTQALDLSSSSIQRVSQQFWAQAGQYILSITFLLPISRPTKKILVILINDIIVFRYHPQMPVF